MIASMLTLPCRPLGCRGCRSPHEKRYLFFAARKSPAVLSKRHHRSYCSLGIQRHAARARTHDEAEAQKRPHGSRHVRKCAQASTLSSVGLKWSGLPVMAVSSSFRIFWHAQRRDVGAPAAGDGPLALLCTYSAGQSQQSPQGRVDPALQASPAATATAHQFPAASAHRCPTCCIFFERRRRACISCTCSRRDLRTVLHVRVAVWPVAGTGLTRAHVSSHSKPTRTERVHGWPCVILCTRTLH